MTKIQKKPSSLSKIWSRLLQNQYFDILILVILCLIVVFINYIWRSIELRPPHWDMGRHLFNSAKYFEYVTALRLKSLYSAYFYYPPLLYLSAVPYFMIFGQSIKVAVLSNATFVFILALSMYGIGHRLWGRRAGLLSAIFVIASPMIVSQFKEYQLDAPATAMTALCLYLLIRSKEFGSRWRSLLFGLVFGLALLTKWTLAFVLFLPISYAIARRLLDDIRRRKSDGLFNILVSLLSTFFVASFWYMHNLGQIAGDLLSNAGAAGVREGDPLMGSFASNTWYLNNLINNQLYVLPTILLVIGIGYCLMNYRKYFMRNIYPWLLVLGSIVFFTLLRNKDARYTLPMLVGVAIIAVFWVSEIKNQYYKNLITFLIVVYSVLSFWIVSFGSPALPSSLRFAGVTLYSQNGYLIGPPTKENWHQQELFEDLSRLENEKLLYTGFSPEEMYFNSWSNRYFAEIYGVSIVEDLSQANYAITTMGQEIGKGSWEIIKKYKLPSGVELLLLKKFGD